MKSVVCDTGPVNYLVQIESVWLIPSLFEPVILPRSCLRELLSESAPGRVRQWADSLPSWMEIREGSSTELSSQKGLSDADIEVLILAIETKSVVLMDDLAARRYAQSLGLAVVGTLGVIEIAARRGLISLRDSFDRLQQTNIRITESLYQQILERNSDLA